MFHIVKHFFLLKRQHSSCTTELESFRWTLILLLDLLRHSIVKKVFLRFVFCRVCDGKVISLNEIGIRAHEEVSADRQWIFQNVHEKCGKKSVLQLHKNSVNVEARRSSRRMSHCCLIKNISAPCDIKYSFHFLCKLTKSAEHVWSWTWQKKSCTDNKTRPSSPFNTIGGFE